MKTKDGYEVSLGMMLDDSWSCYEVIQVNQDSIVVREVYWIGDDGDYKLGGMTVLFPHQVKQLRWV